MARIANRQWIMDFSMSPKGMLAGGHKAVLSIKATDGVKEEITLYDDYAVKLIEDIGIIEEMQNNALSR